jgi:hypothetical protein
MNRLPGASLSVDGVRGCCALRWVAEAAGMAERSGLVEREVRWVEAVVAQQAEAVWQLLYADAAARPSRGRTKPPGVMRCSLVWPDVHQCNPIQSSWMVFPGNLARTRRMLKVAGHRVLACCVLTCTLPTRPALGGSASALLLA